MNRKTSQLPWGAGNRPSLYGGPRQARPGRQWLVLGAIGLGVLVLASFAIGRVCSSSDCTEYYCPSDRSIEAPEGYEFVSRIFAYNVEKPEDTSGKDLLIAVELKKQVPEGAALSFYRYVDETKNWEPIAPAVLDAQGKVVSATFAGRPSLMAVMRRNSPGGHVIAYLPHNAALHGEAAGHVSIVHTLDFKPAADGNITGDLSTIKPEGFE